MKKQKIRIISTGSLCNKHAAVDASTADDASTKFFYLMAIFPELLRIRLDPPKMKFCKVAKQNFLQARYFPCVIFLSSIANRNVQKYYNDDIEIYNRWLSECISRVIIRSTCNSRDTLLSEALIYRLRGHYVGLRRKSGPIRYIRAL